MEKLTMVRLPRQKSEVVYKFLTASAAWDEFRLSRCGVFVNEPDEVILSVKYLKMAESDEVLSDDAQLEYRLVLLLDQLVPEWRAFDYILVTD